MEVVIGGRLGNGQACARRHPNTPATGRHRPPIQSPHAHVKQGGQVVVTVFTAAHHAQEQVDLWKGLVVGGVTAGRAPAARPPPRPHPPIPPPLRPLRSMRHALDGEKSSSTAPGGAPVSAKLSFD